MSVIIYSSDHTPNRPDKPASSDIPRASNIPNTSPSSDDPVAVFSFKDRRHHKTVIIAQQSDNKFLCFHELDGCVATIEIVKAYDILRLRGEHGNPEVDSETVWLFAYRNENGSKKAVLLEGWSHQTRYHNGNPTSLFAFAMDHTDPFPHIANQIMRCLQADGR